MARKKKLHLVRAGDDEGRARHASGVFGDAARHRRQSELLRAGKVETRRRRDTTEASYTVDVGAERRSPGPAGPRPAASGSTSTARLCGPCPGTPPPAESPVAGTVLEPLLDRLHIVPADPQPSWGRWVVAPWVSATLVAVGKSVFPGTVQFHHYTFQDYAKLTIIGAANRPRRLAS